MCRKNWTSSWTVLQGSSLLFAKGQGGSTSWVRNPSAFIFPHQPSFWAFFLAFHSSLCYFSLPYFCIVFCIHHCLCCEFRHPLFIALSSPLVLLSSLKSYYRSGSIPELLLTLLSNWKRSVKPRPAVSYVNCRPVQAAAVCPRCLHAFLLLTVFHSFIHYHSLPRLLTERLMCVCVCVDLGFEVRWKPFYQIYGPQKPLKFVKSLSVCFILTCLLLQTIFKALYDNWAACLSKVRSQDCCISLP